MKKSKRIFGEEIGRGKTRIVHVHRQNSSWVIKRIVEKENNIRPQSNKIEWDVWNAVEDTEFARFFCPCVDLTAEGHLIMFRCEPIKKIRKRIPTILDVKPPRDSKASENYGSLEGRSVLIDYGHTDFIPLIETLEHHKKLK